MNSSHVFLNPYRDIARLMGSPANPEIRTFHQSLPHYRVTRLHSLPAAAKDLNVRHVLLKDESCRLALPAFKILGASWATAQALLKRLDLQVADVKDISSAGISLDRLASFAQAAGVVLYAATDGNHGRAVARMAKYLGVQANIFAPRVLDQEAQDNITSEGAQVKVVDGDYDQTVLETKTACEQCSDGKGLLISDTALEFGDETAQWIVDGYQTMFDEIDEQLVDVTAGRPITHVISPVGVGSLTQAVVSHFSRITSPTKTAILTVEPEKAACLKASLEAGQMVSVKTGYTICTGLCCGTLSVSAWPVLRDSVSAALTVDDQTVDAAVRELHSYGIEAGPCGGATLAGLRQTIGVEGLGMNPQSVVLIICTEGTRGYVLDN